MWCQDACTHTLGNGVGPLLGHLLDCRAACMPAHALVFKVWVAASVPSLACMGRASAVLPYPQCVAPLYSFRLLLVSMQAA